MKGYNESKVAVAVDVAVAAVVAVVVALAVVVVAVAVDVAVAVAVVVVKATHGEDNMEAADFDQSQTNGFIVKFVAGIADAVVAGVVIAVAVVVHGQISTVGHDCCCC